MVLVHAACHAKADSWLYRSGIGYYNFPAPHLLSDVLIISSAW